VFDHIFGLLFELILLFVVVVLLVNYIFFVGERKKKD